TSISSSAGARNGLVTAARWTTAWAPANARASEAESSSDAGTCVISTRAGGVRPAETGSCPCASSSRTTYEALEPLASVSATLTWRRTSPGLVLPPRRPRRLLEHDRLQEGDRLLEPLGRVDELVLVLDREH